MRFIIFHKTNARWEAGERPGPDLLARVGALLGDLEKAEVLQGAEGLRASSEGVRLTFHAGTRAIVHGPFAGSNELPAGFSILRTSTLDEAIDWATRQAQMLGPEEDVEIDIRPVTEPWDIGMAPAPAALSTRRYMVLRKATPATEAGVVPSPAQRAELSRLIEAATRTGVHISTESMRPSRRGRRLTNFRNGIVMVDGPFAETKELIAGFIIVSAPSIEDATRWAERYTTAVEAHEVDLRELD